MLPKFASHVFHHSQRTALRNVLGFGQNQAAAAGGSGWAGSSAGGAGGAKFNAGSRFYSGYNSAGRSVTQANQTSAHDSTNGRTDEDDEHHLSRSSFVIRPRSSRRPRSSSVHLTGTGRRERQETFGVLQTIQLHQARKAHALAQASASQDGKELFFEEHDEEEGLTLNGVSSPKIRVRRNSTAASNASDLASLETLEPLTKEALQTDPVAPQSVLNTEVGSETVVPSSPKANAVLLADLSTARSVSDAPTAVISTVNSFLQSSRQAPGTNVHDFNAMLGALVSSRVGGQPITVILQTYNDMLTRQIAPNADTYRILVLALCERDREAARVSAQLEWRIKRRALVSVDSAMDSRDAKQLEMLQKENNFGSALVVFEAAQTMHQDAQGRNISLGTEVYDALLRSCMLHSNTGAAVRIWESLESAKGFIPSASCFLHLLGTYASVGNFDAAKDIVTEFELLAKEGRLGWAKHADDDARTLLLADSERSGKARATQMLVYVKLIESAFASGQPQAALAILERMMDSVALASFGPSEMPPPCSAVYAACVRGFLENGDLESALGWFQRMRAPDAKSVPEHALMPLEGGVVARPDQALWDIVMEKLLENGKLEQVNSVFKDLVDASESEVLRVRSLDRLVLFQRNMGALAKGEVEPTKIEETTTFTEVYIVRPLLDGVTQTGHPNVALASQAEAFVAFIALLANTGRLPSAYTLLKAFISNSRMLLNTSGAESDKRLIRNMQRTITSLLPTLLFEADKQALGVDEVLRMAEVMDMAFMEPQIEIAQAFLEVYSHAKASGEISALTDDHWIVFAYAYKLLLTSKASVLVTHENVKAFSQDLVAAYPDSERAPRVIVQELVKATVDAFGIESAKDVFGLLGSAWTRVLAKQEALLTPPPTPNGPAAVTASTPHPNANTTSSPYIASLPVHGDQAEHWPPPSVFNSEQAANSKRIKIDKALSRSVDEYYPANPRVTPEMAYNRYSVGAARGAYPFPDVMGRLIATFGRQGDLEKVLSIYTAAQSVLASPPMANDKAKQSLAWYELEDQMIVGLAHAGHVDKAHIHRSRILAQGGTPSADAYGALIQCVKETTDDSASALALWTEARSRGVVANLYLYNTTISKLSRARKADYALELFAQMKRDYVRPSSVTYGAIIAACCRVGDAQSAENLFEEMVGQKNFRPRIPPYNTMIQFYTHTIRDRERALKYYEKLVEAGIAPTAHTYKLLLDCYGTIEPVDVSSMEDVFAALVGDRRVQVQGVHWAALLNAYGCVLKDLDKAVELFDSIASHPSTLRAKTTRNPQRLPDALVYEALVNVLVTHHKTELLPAYLAKMHQDGVHMTAYIANLLIRGYACTGQMEEARRVFESLSDAPMGCAAPNNHAPHDPQAVDVAAQVWGHVDPDAPVYREPSTWEAMVRAELGDGNRDAAMDLLRRVQERGFPPAVVARISGIMHDDTQMWTGAYAYAAPWPMEEAMVQQQAQGQVWSPYMGSQTSSP